MERGRADTILTALYVMLRMASGTSLQDCAAFPYGRRDNIQMKPLYLGTLLGCPWDVHFYMSWSEEEVGKK